MMEKNIERDVLGYDHNSSGGDQGPLFFSLYILMSWVYSENNDGGD